MSKIKTLMSVSMVSVLLISCTGTRHLTNEEIDRRTKIDNQLDWLYWNYSNTRDSLLIEYHKQ